MDVLPLEQAKAEQMAYKDSTYVIVSKIAYLIGVPKRIFENEENIIKLDGDVIVVGDIHGSFHDLLRILKYVQENDNKVLFLGDYVDRGDFSLECITILFSFKVLYPNNFFLLRGNHEFDTMCNQYGFKDEVLNYHNPKKVKESIHDNDYSRAEKEKKPNKSKTSIKNKKYDEYYASHNNMDCYNYSEKLYEAFLQTFSYLPNGCVVNNCFSMMYPKLHLYPAVRMVTNYNGRKITNHKSEKIMTMTLPISV